MKFTLLALLLTGCVSNGMVAQSYNAQQWEREALAHGCMSGESAAGNIFSKYVKDYNQYDNNPNYAKRYEDAYRQCFHNWKNSVFNVRGN